MRKSYRLVYIFARFGAQLDGFADQSKENLIGALGLAKF
jgi:hypothetical protein